MLYWLRSSLGDLIEDPLEVAIAVNEECSAAGLTRERFQTCPAAFSERTALHR